MKKKIMAVLLALAMVTQGAMPVFAQNEGAEGIETAADAETAKILCKEYLSEEQQIQGIDQRFENTTRRRVFCKRFGKWYNHAEF